MPEKFGSDIIMSRCNLINNSSILRDFSLKVISMNGTNKKN